MKAFTYIDQTCIIKTKFYITQIKLQLRGLFSGLAWRVASKSPRWESWSMFDTSCFHVASAGIAECITMPRLESRGLFNRILLACRLGGKHEEQSRSENNYVQPRASRITKGNQLRWASKLPRRESRRSSSKHSLGHHEARRKINLPRRESRKNSSKHSLGHHESRREINVIVILIIIVIKQVLAYVMGSGWDICIADALHEPLPPNTYLKLVFLIIFILYRLKLP